MNFIKVFSISDPDKEQDIINEWIDSMYEDYERFEVISISQSETAIGSRETFEIMKFLNDHKDLGHVFVCCNNDFYIFLVEK